MLQTRRSVLLLNVIFNEVWPIVDCEIFETNLENGASCWYALAEWNAAHVQITFIWRLII